MILRTKLPLVLTFSVLASIVVVHEVTAQQTYGKQLKRVTQWKAVDYVFPTAQDREQAIASRRFIPENCLPLDMDVDYNSNNLRSRVFVTVPRFEGVPATLGVVSKQKGPSGPLIEPYPSWEIQSNYEDSSCNGFVSVFRIRIDECNRLWVLDTGKIGITGRRVCLPKIVVFDLQTDQIIHQYQIPADQLMCDVSLPVSILVDVQDPSPIGSCCNTMVYLADIRGFGLIVYDMARGKSWRVTNKLMNPDPKHGTFTIADESFDLMDGIITMSLSPKAPAPDSGSLNSAYGWFQPSRTAVINDRILFFHALASVSENAVRTSVLHNQTLWEQNAGAEPQSFRVIGRRTTQSAPEAMDSNGNMFFGLLNQMSIGCWDSTTNYNPSNIRVVSQNYDTLQFPSGMKVIRNRKGVEELWVLSCRFQKYMTGSMNISETNFRIQAIQIPELLDGSRSCKLGRS